MPAYTYVVRPERAVVPIEQAADLGVDTEFMREKTFYPQLCLVQVATGADCLVVDPLTGGDLSPFWDAVLHRRWIAHSARQDIEVVYQAAGRMPADLFDTQIAAALLGHPPQLGYAGLVKALFDVDLPKSHTRANWAARPLPDELLAYAAEDVEYLLPAREVLAGQLDGKGRLEWAAADSAMLLETGLYAVDPASAAARLKSLRNLGGARRAAAVALAAWREAEAMRRNLPRQWILKDSVLTEIAVRLPADATALARIEGLPPRVAKRAGAELLAAVSAARRDSADDGNGRARRGAPDARQKAALKAMQARVLECANDLGVAAETIASKKELASAVIEGVRGSRIFSGWRKELIGDQLAQMLT